MCSPFSQCRAITKCSTCQFSKGKGYFQRMKIDFPLDLCIIKEHNNETSFSLWFPPAAFWHLAELSFHLMTCEWKSGRRGSVCSCCCIHPFHTAIQKEDICCEILIYELVPALRHIRMISKHVVSEQDQTGLQLKQAILSRPAIRGNQPRLNRIRVILRLSVCTDPLSQSGKYWSAWLIYGSVHLPDPGLNATEYTGGKTGRVEKYSRAKINRYQCRQVGISRSVGGGRQRLASLVWTAGVDS